MLDVSRNFDNNKKSSYIKQRERLTAIKRPLIVATTFCLKNPSAALTIVSKISIENLLCIMKKELTKSTDL